MGNSDSSDSDTDWYPTLPPTPVPTAFIDQSCPSPAFRFCAKSGKHCDIPNGIHSGYIAYGSNGTFILRPFTVSGANAWKILCANSPFAHAFGWEPHCCYISTGTQFADTNYQRIAANHSLSLHSNGITAVKDCITSHIDGKAATGCTYDIYNSSVISLPSVSKKLDHSYSYSTNTTTNRALSLLKYISWQPCGTGGDECTGLDTSSLYWIRYGADGVYTYQLVVSSKGHVHCGHHALGSVQSHRSKHQFCWASPPQYVFSNMAGRWQLQTDCRGCSIQHSYTYGVTGISEEQITESWTEAITWSFSLGFELSAEFMGAGAKETGNYELGGSLSDTVTDSISESFSHTLQETDTEVCNKGALYQWEMSATEYDGFDDSDIGVQGDYFLCIDSGYTPRCPPTFCKDDNCQECTVPLGNMQSSSAGQPVHKKMNNHMQLIYGLAAAVVFLLILLLIGIWFSRKKANYAKQRKNLMQANEAAISYGAT